MVGGEAFVVPGAAAVAGDPGQGPLDNPAAQQDFEGVLAFGPPDDLDGQSAAQGRSVSHLGLTLNGMDRNGGFG
jgi:hypothetical protein